MVRSDVMPTVYQVIIHPCVDTTGYWAECISLPGCFTDGETLQETQKNMFEAVNLFLNEDGGNVENYYLNFEVRNA